MIAMKRHTVTVLRSIPTALAVSAISLLPVLSWQFVDARSSAVVASPVAAAMLARETVLGKTSLTWGHKKSDRLNLTVNLQNPAVKDVNQSAPVIDVTSLDDDGSIDRQSEVASIAVHNSTREQFADWLVVDETGSGTPQIIDFASRKTNENRKACRSQHDAIVTGFGVEKARVLADKPVLFQSSICAGNGEIVITCFGTSATLSPRKSRPGDRCARSS